MRFHYTYPHSSISDETIAKDEVRRVVLACLNNYSTSFQSARQRGLEDDCARFNSVLNALERLAKDLGLGIQSVYEAELE